MSKKNTEVPTLPKSGNAGGSSSQTCDHQVRTIIEEQNAKMLSIIKTLLKQNAAPLNSDGNLVLPDFDPDAADADARSWSAAAGLCLADQTLGGPQLMRLVSKAMKGSASTWLTQVSYADMTWKEFQDLFINRFGQLQTDAGALINLENQRPNTDETLAAYANRLVTSFVNRWKDSNIEQIAVSTVLAHIALFDSDVRRMAITTEVSSRHDLQKELQAFSLKRKCPRSYETNTSEVNKRAKLGQLLKCSTCGHTGHNESECLLRGTDFNVSSQTASAQEKTKILCFKCGVEGFLAIGRGVTSMTSAGSGAAASGGAGDRPAAGILEQLSSSSGARKAGKVAAAGGDGGRSVDILTLVPSTIAPATGMPEHTCVPVTSGGTGGASGGGVGSGGRHAERRGQPPAAGGKTQQTKHRCFFNIDEYRSSLQVRRVGGRSRKLTRLTFAS